MSDEPWSVGRYIVALLAAKGIDTVFGIPGVHNLEFCRGLAATGLRHILVRHEQNAGFAADGFARASGRPAGTRVWSPCRACSGTGGVDGSYPIGAVAARASTRAAAAKAENNFQRAQSRGVVHSHSFIRHPIL